MAVFPLFVELKGKKCIVVGGGNVATRKIDTLLKFDADITVISPEASERINELDSKGKIKLIRKEYSMEDIEGAFMVIAATSDSCLNSKIWEDCVKKGAFVNVADNPEKCTFVFPSIVKRGNMVLGISTSGGYPLLARYTRKEIEKIFPQHFERVVNALEGVRKRALDQIDDPNKRKELLNNIIDQITPLGDNIEVKNIDLIIEKTFREYKDEKSD